MKKLQKLSMALAVSLTGAVLPIKTASAEIVYGPSNFVPMTPCRVFDTRGGVAGVPAPFNTPDDRGNEEREFFIWSVDTEEQGGNPDACITIVPNTAIAVHINFSVVSPTVSGFLRAWPRPPLPEPGEEPEPAPTASLLGWVGGSGISNATAISINNDDGTDLTVKVFHPAGSTPSLDLVGDVVGYYVSVPTSGAASVLAAPATVSGRVRIHRK